MFQFLFRSFFWGGVKGCSGIHFSDPCRGITFSNVTCGTGRWVEWLGKGGGGLVDDGKRVE